MNISIIMVAYNSSLTIARALESIKKQTRPPYEVLLIDGNSKDDTLKVAKRFNSSLPLKIFSESDNGIYDAMNKGLRLAKGDIVGFLNTDDEYSNKDSLERVYKAFEENSNTEIFVSGVDYLKSENKISREWRLKGISPFYTGWHPPHPGFYTKRELLLNLKGFNESYKIASDFDLMLRSFQCVENEQVHIDKKKLVNMYLGGASNASFQNILLGNREIRASLNSMGFRVTWLYTLKRLVKKYFSKKLW